MGDIVKYTEEEIKNMFSDGGCELLSKFKNTTHPLKYRCSCGNITTTQFHHFKNGGKKCRKCSKRFTIEKVQKIFEKEGCELLSDRYINNSQKLKYKCCCGEIGYIALNNFSMGKRCRKCAAIKRSGEGNGNYNPKLTYEERIERREYPEYREWRKAVFKRDGYTCQKCGDSKGGNLNAHHIRQHYKFPKLRTSLSNGITLCKRRHDSFHNQQGWKYYTFDNFRDFMRGRLCQ